jgi:hypothetical protein
MHWGRVNKSRSLKPNTASADFTEQVGLTKMTIRGENDEHGIESLVERRAEALAGSHGTNFVPWVFTGIGHF